MKALPASSSVTLLVLREAGRPVKQLHLSRPMAVAIPAAAVLSLSSLVTSMHYHAADSIARLESQATALSLENRMLKSQSQSKDRTLAYLREEVTGLSEEADRLRGAVQSVDALERRLQELTGGEDRARPEAAKAAQASGASSAASDAAGGGRSTAAGVGGSAAPGDERSAAPGAGRSAAASGGGSAQPVQGADSAAGSLAVRIGSYSALIPPGAAAWISGEYVAVHETEASRLLGQTRDDFAEMNRLLDEVTGRLSAAVTEADAKARAAAAATRASAGAAPPGSPGETAQNRQSKGPSVVWPTLSKVISSSFGYRTDPFEGSSAFHSGVDIAGNAGDPVFAAMAGTVLYADESRSRGKYVVLDHGNGLCTWYMHLSSFQARPGTAVRKGQIIGRLGSTGRSTGPHLHFQVEKKNTPVNPLPYLRSD